MSSTPVAAFNHPSGELKFAVSNGTSRKLIFSRPELETLRANIDKCLEATRVQRR